LILELDLLGVRGKGKRGEGTGKRKRQGKVERSAEDAIVGHYWLAV
jgi:hypothetical protein